MIYSNSNDTPHYSLPAPLDTLLVISGMGEGWQKQSYEMVKAAIDTCIDQLDYIEVKSPNGATQRYDFTRSTADHGQQS